MNAQILNAINSRKEEVDAQYSTSSYGDGTMFMSSNEKASGFGYMNAQYYQKQYGDKSKTGFTGLVNQGATCYLNSFIQSLFMTPELRQAIYEWDDNNCSDKDFSIAYQLRHLFARLQLTAAAAINTTDLTKSFGWDVRDIFLQHDVQELYHVLFDQLAIQCVEQSLSTRLNVLTRGHSIDYVKCQTCLKTNERSDSFIDIALQVKGCNSLYDSFDYYLKPDILAGDNAYRCDACQSKQPAEKGTKFTKLPYILVLQLKRFAMNWNTLTRYKLNDSLPIEEFLNLEKYCSNAGNYELFSILIHTGGAGGGHYFTYTKDFTKSKWLRFDDATVTELNDEEIKTMWSKDNKLVSSNDSNKSNINTSINNDSKQKPFVDPQSNAYMLMYRRIDKNINLNQVTPESIPESIRSQIEKENSDYIVAKEEAKRLQNLVRLTVHEQSGEREIRIEINKDATMTELMLLIKKELSLDSVNSDDLRIRLYNFSEQSPMRPFTKRQANKTVIDAGLKNFFHIYIEKKDENGNFEEWNAPQVSLQVCLYNDEKNEFSEDIKTISVDAETGNVGDVRQAVACLLQVKVNKCRLMIPRGKTDVEILKNDDLFLGDLNIRSHDIIYCESIINENDNDSRMVKKFVDEGSKISIYFNSFEVAPNNDMENKTHPLDTTYSTNIPVPPPIANQKNVSDSNSGIPVPPPIANQKNVSDSNSNIPVPPPIVKQKNVSDSNSNIPVPPPPPALAVSIPLVPVPPPIISNTTKSNNIETTNKIQSDCADWGLVIHSASVDGRGNLLDLKTSISKILELELDEFLLKSSPHGSELKDLNCSLQQYRLVNGSHVYVEKGQPLAPNMRRFKIYRASNTCNEFKEPVSVHEFKLPESQQLYIGESILCQEWTMNQVREKLFEQFGKDKVPEPNQMRIREKCGRKKMYISSKLLKDNALGKSDGKELLIEETEIVDNNFMNDNDGIPVLLYVSRWYPLTKQLGPATEKICSNNLKINELRNIISQLYNIENEDVRMVKARMYQMKDEKSILKLNWFGLNISPDSRIGDTPWYAKDGDLILVTNNKEAQQQRIQDRTIEEEKNAVNSQKKLPTILPMREQGIKFRSSDELAKLQKKRQEEAKQRQVEMEQARQDAIKRREDTAN